MGEDLFEAADVALPVARPERVLMSLHPEYYDLIWRGEKRHEFRRRYLTGRPSTWFVYLTAPVSRLTAVIDLDTPVMDTPDGIAALAEHARAGNGASVLAYLRDLDQGFALPILRVREFPGLSQTDLRRRLGGFHPPQGYTLIDRHPALAGVCADLLASPLLRELAVPDTASVG